MIDVPFVVLMALLAGAIVGGHESLTPRIETAIHAVAKGGKAVGHATKVSAKATGRALKKVVGK